MLTNKYQHDRHNHISVKDIIGGHNRLFLTVSKFSGDICGIRIRLDGLNYDLNDHHFTFQPDAIHSQAGVPSCWQPSRCY